ESPASGREPPSSSVTSTGRKIHKVAVAAQTASVARAPRLIGPSAAAASAMAAGAPGACAPAPGGSCRASHHQHASSISAEAGAAISIQWAKEIGSPLACAMKRAAMPLGGEPISVTIPPIDAAYATA